jgi:hypothetical protein
MGKLGTENLVLAKKQKEDRRSDANRCDGLGKVTGDFAHQIL